MMKEVRLGSLIEFQRGYDLTHSNMKGETYPVVGSTSVIGFHDDYKASDGIVIGRSGSVGKPQLIRGPYWPHNTVLFSTTLKGNDLNYMYYLIENLGLDRMKTGSNIPTLNRNDLYPLKIKAETDPSIQKELVKPLVLIDSQIANNNAIISELESLAKDIYNYWFVQFDFPDENGRPYKSSGGKMVWNEELKREIPKGWKSSSFNEFISSCKNGDWGSDSRGDNSDIAVNCFRGADFPTISKDHRMTAPLRYIKNKSKDRLLNQGDLIVEISGGSPTQSTGRVGYVNSELLSRSQYPMVCSNFCKAFSPINVEYTYWLYNTWEMLYEIGAMFNYESKTTGIKNLMFDDLTKSLKIAAPSLDVVSRFHRVVGPLYSMIQKLLKESEELASLRDWLLPMLMNGQVKIRTEGDKID